MQVVTIVPGEPAGKGAAEAGLREALDPPTREVAVGGPTVNVAANSSHGQ